ncbi:MAG: hypothetical protein IT317_07895 [Anaerolineales bacterium]|nr:hypothetical protein [Anaerolineales bacterium]
MTASNPSPPTAAAAPARALRRYRLGALLFVALGALLLAANLNLLAPAAQRVVAVGWPVVVILAGAWVLLWGRAPAGVAAPTFTLARGEAARGALEARAGTTDVTVRAWAPSDGAAAPLASGNVAVLCGPWVSAQDGRARVRLSTSLAMALLANQPWAVALGPGLPWELRWQSSLGDLTLDLRGLEVSQAALGSTLGHVDLTLPEAGQPEIDVRLSLGNLTVRVPETMAVRVKVRRGRLAALRPDARRFAELAPGEWATPLFAVSPHRCTLTVALGAGDLTLM